MNERQLARRRRFAAMRERQIAKALRRFQPDRADCEISRGAGKKWCDDPSRNQYQLFTDHARKLVGQFAVEHWRGGKLIGTHKMPNGIVNQGLNDNLDTYFDSGTQITSWYMGLINLTGYTLLDPTDTYDDIDQAGNGWDTFASYTDANNGDSATTRPEWPPDAASGQSITNTTTKAIFDITGAGTVKGIFICGGTNAQTKGDHTAAGNILWSTALFSGGDVVVASSDQLKVTYTVNASTS